VRRTGTKKNKKIEKNRVEGQEKLVSYLKMFLVVEE
jgi:hypothetical protein